MAKSFDFIQPNRILFRILRIFGFWRFSDSGTMQPFNRRYGIATSIWFILYVAMISINVAVVEDLENATESMFMSLVLVALLVKIFNFVLKENSVLDLFDRFIDSEITLNSNQEIKSFKKSYQKFKFFRNIYFGLGCFGVVLTSLIPLATEQRTLPLNAWYHFNWRASDAWYAGLFIYQLIGYLIIAILTFAIDAHMNYVMFQIGMFYQLTRMRLKNIKKINQKNSENYDAVDELIKSIKMYHSVKKMEKLSEDIYGFPYFIQLNITVFLICLCAFHLSIISPNQNPTKFLKYICYICGASVEVYFPCFYGNEITVQHSALMNAVYSSDWTEFSMKYRQLTFVFMEFLKMPSGIRCCNLIPLNLQTFASILNSAYSFLAVLRNLRSS